MRSIAITAAPPPQDIAFSRALASYADGLLRQAESTETASVQESFDAARRLDPDSRRPVDAAVLQLLEQKRPAAALDALEVFCRNHPDDFAAQRDLARLAEAGEDYKRAALYCDAAARLHPDDLTLAAGRIRALFAAKRDREALCAMRTLAHDKPSPDTRTLPIFWAMTFIRRTNEPARALPCIEVAATTATSTAQRVECRVFYGETALVAGRTNDALEAFQKALNEDPAQIRAALALGALLQARDGAAALARQTRRAERAPRDLAAWLILAGLQIAAQDRTNAIVALSHARSLFDAGQLTPPVAFDLLQGGTLDELGRGDEAAAIFKEALHRHPRADIIMNYLAYMWAVANVRLDEAERLAQQAVQQKPRNGAYLDTLGWVRYRQQRFADALTLLLQAQEKMPDDPTVLDHLGDALASLNRIPEATAFWSRSFAVDATQVPVAAKLRAQGVNPARIPRVTPRPETEADDDESE